LVIVERAIVKGAKRQLSSAIERETCGEERGDNRRIGDSRSTSKRGGEKEEFVHNSKGVD